MKRMLQGVCLIMFLTSLGLTGCSGDSPKTLAKEAYQMYLDGMKYVELGKRAEAGEDIGMSEAEGLAIAAKELKRASELNQKFEALSPADKKIFEEERDRLMREGK